MAMTRRTMERERGMTASRPAEAAPAPGPKTVMRSRSPWRRDAWLDQVNRHSIFSILSMGQFSLTWKVCTLS